MPTIRHAGLIGPRTARRLFDLLDAPDEVSPVAGSPSLTANIETHWVQIDNATPDGNGFYTGQWLLPDVEAGAMTFTTMTDVLIIDAAGATLALSTKYLGRLVGSRGGLPVYVTRRSFAASDISVDDTNAVDISFTPSTGVLNIPDAAAAQRGAMTSAAQTFGGEKTFGGTVLSNGVTSALDSTMFGFVHSTGVGSVNRSAFLHDSSTGATSKARISGTGTMIRNAYATCEPPLGDGADAITFHSRFMLRGSVTDGNGVGTLTNDPQPYFGIHAGATAYIGQWQTVAGLSFSGGLLTGGTLSLSGVSITGTTGTIDGGTW